MNVLKLQLFSFLLENPSLLKNFRNFLCTFFLISFQCVQILENFLLSIFILYISEFFSFLRPFLLFIFLQVSYENRIVFTRIGEIRLDPPFTTL